VIYSQRVQYKLYTTVVTYIPSLVTRDNLIINWVTDAIVAYIPIACASAPAPCANKSCTMSECPRDDA